MTLLLLFLSVLRFSLRVIRDLPSPDLSHEIIEYFVHILPGLSRSLHIRNLKSYKTLRLFRTHRTVCHCDACVSVVAGVSRYLISRPLSYTTSYLPLLCPVVGSGLLHLPTVGEVRLIPHQDERNVTVSLHS